MIYCVRIRRQVGESIKEKAIYASDNRKSNGESMELLLRKREVLRKREKTNPRKGNDSIIKVSPIISH